MAEDAEWAKLFLFQLCKRNAQVFGKIILAGTYIKNMAVYRATRLSQLARDNREGVDSSLADIQSGTSGPPLNTDTVSSLDLSSLGQYVVKRMRTSPTWQHRWSPGPS